MPGPIARLIERALADTAGDLPPGASRPIAVGWATVELDRAASELTHELGLTPDAFVAAADCRALGARCRVAVDAWPPGTAIAILEPATEGQLAESLARYGEGPTAIWYRAAAAVRAPTSGPFGLERPVPGEPMDRIHRFLVATEPGTIAG